MPRLIGAIQPAQYINGSGPSGALDIHYAEAPGYSCNISQSGIA
ncbi:MAG: hypothetical protein WEA04_02915 [Candidatus Andersenbacteria bacterium]